MKLRYWRIRRLFDAVAKIEDGKIVFTVKGDINKAIFQKARKMFPLVTDQTLRSYTKSVILMAERRKGSLSNTLLHTNRAFYNFILPNKKLILYSPKVPYKMNNIMFTSGIIYGGSSSAKSVLAMSIAEKTIKKYGVNNVNAVMESYGDLKKILIYGIKKSLVNILFTDLTLRPIKKSVLRLYFQISDLYKRAFEINNGYILSLLGLRRFPVSATELRSNMDFLIVNSLPSSHYDFKVIERKIGEDGLELLGDIEKSKVTNPDYKRYSVYWLKTGEIGLLDTPLPQKNYMKVT